MICVENVQSFLRELNTVFRVENVRLSYPGTPDTRRNLAKLRLVSGVPGHRTDNSGHFFVCASQKGLYNNGKTTTAHQTMSGCRVRRAL
jgi:hypothetical protein